MSLSFVKQSGYPAPVLINNAGAVGSPMLNQSTTDQRYALLQRDVGPNNNVFLYVYSTLCIAQNLLVVVNPLTGKATTCTPAVAAILGNVVVGVTDSATINALNYGWITIAGLCSVKSTKNAGTGAAAIKGLFVSATTGAVTNSATLASSAQAIRSRPRIMGAYIIKGTASTSASLTTIFIAGGGAFFSFSV